MKQHMTQEMIATPLPKGFLASGINCGVRRTRPDLGLLTSEYPCVAVGVFTLNTCTAAPVRYCQQLLPSQQIYALITNSGQANAATGDIGDEDNLALVKATADALQLKNENILIASTGIIGYRLALDKIIPAISTLVQERSEMADPFAAAILTTDLVKKIIHKKLTLSSGEITITGICKGSGMIHPNMATMLGYFLTDAVLQPQQAQEFLKSATDVSFNMISVDNQMSTNDSAFLLANGSSQVALKTPEDEQLFLQTLIEMAQYLAKAIARDGEGATKLLEVQVHHAKDEEMARRLARAVTTSDLFKCAVYGSAAYWGRVLAVLGQQDISLKIIDNSTIHFQEFLVYPPQQANYVKADLDASMKRELVVITINLNCGNASATAWGCDMSEQYVKINADYGT